MASISHLRYIFIKIKLKKKEKTNYLAIYSLTPQKQPSVSTKSRLKVLRAVLQCMTETLRPPHLCLFPFLHRLIFHPISHYGCLLMGDIATLTRYNKSF